MCVFLHFLHFLQTIVLKYFCFLLIKKISNTNESLSFITWGVGYGRVCFGHLSGGILFRKPDTGTDVRRCGYDDGCLRRRLGKISCDIPETNTIINSRLVILHHDRNSYLATISSIICVNQPVLIINRSGQKTLLTN